MAIYEKEPDAVIVTEEDLITHGFSEGRFECFVGEHQDHGVIGMALYYPRYSTWKGPTLHLEDLYVKPEFRQHGVGKQLFDAVVKVAAKQNVGRMESAGALRVARNHRPRNPISQEEGEGRTKEDKNMNNR